MQFLKCLVNHMSIILNILYFLFYNTSFWIQPSILNYPRDQKFLFYPEAINTAFPL